MSSDRLPRAVPPRACWVCGSEGWSFFKRSDINAPLASQNFAITDSDYGVTGALFRCRQCGFVQCADVAEVTSFYEALEDPEYEDGRPERLVQARKLLDLVPIRTPRGRLLDIGAGSGILVEAALERGYLAEGVEPSRWLAAEGRERGLTIHTGTLPHPAVASSYDVVTMIDVLEHVSDPLGLLRLARDRMAPGGVGLVVTPDVGSLAARLLGRRWWHFRVAHIGYFNRGNLAVALGRSGLAPVATGRPGWYFRGSYLRERLQHYLPSWLRLPRLAAFDRLTVPLNLRDSLYVLFKRSGKDVDGR